MSNIMSYTGAAEPAPGPNTTAGYSFYKAIFDHIFAQHNATDASVTSLLAQIAAGVTAGHVPASGITGLLTGSQVDATIALSANVPTKAGAGATGAWGGITIAGSQINQGSIGPDRQSGLWYTAGVTAMTVAVAAKNVWNVSTFIQFNGGVSPVISTVGMTSGQARIDLLYIDPSGSLQWAIGPLGPAASAILPVNPVNAFVPIVYVKTYFGAGSINGYADLGFGSYFFADARLDTTPLSAAALGAHSVSFSRMQDGSLFQSSPASTTVNIGAISYFNSSNVFQTYGGGVYTYSNSNLLNSQPRWDLLYLDDSGTLQIAFGTPAASPSKPNTQIGQWPIGYVFVPASTTNFVDLVNYTAAVGQGYLLAAPGYLRSMTTGALVTTAVLGAVTVAGGAVTAIAVTSGGSGYTVAPTVNIVGSNTTPATAHAVLSGGVITSIVIDSGGTGYTAPTANVSTSGAVQSVLLGGTGASTQATARSNLGAAASGTNADIGGMTLLSAITGNVAFAGNQIFRPSAISTVPVTINGLSGQTAVLQSWQVNGVTVGELGAAGQMGIGRASQGNTGIIHGGTYGSAGGAIGIYEGSVLKPTAAAQPAWGIASAPSFDTSLFTIPTGYAIYVPTLAKSGANAVTTLAGIYAAAQSSGTNNYSIYSDGLIFGTGGVSMDSSGGTGIIDGSSYNPAMNKFSSSLLSAVNNQFGLMVQNTVPTAVAGSVGLMKAAIAGYIYTADPSVYTGGSPYTHDHVAGDFRAMSINGSTNTRLWAVNLMMMVGTSGVTGTTGTTGGGVCIEALVANHGEDVSLIAIGTLNMKIGANFVISPDGDGTGTNGTAGVVISTSGSCIWHHGFFVYANAIGSTGSDTAFELQGLWAVKSTGAMAIGGIAPTAATMLDVLGNTRYTGIERKGTGARVVPVTGATITPTTDIVRLNPAAAVTGIKVAAGVSDGGTAAGSNSTLTIINESAFTITFAAYDGSTAFILDGVANPMPATSARTWIWNGAAAAWYRNQ